ncbi:hypothetical protein FA10DRAFT_179012 [Acaromyces ingoldii]|uniref:Gti1/Pac2 family-domain-containing protein n=1 Tax=Acaromyces ingoldii TaxID=215250 RepID=A0A316YG93_9BASI|nr:hypothetical protein FA10DRAFT_179012 [Acaromyces ingoldii]PWN87864.1 hypothetical protein FA10DRAFT_179012 [Acaromyces ingoldii]
MSNEAESTYHGYISSTHDALLVFECVRRGVMPKIKRRLRDDERKLIRSGQVFVFDERESGIKRWTDGLLWSPSRILMNFLIYRQIDKRQAATRAAAESSSFHQYSVTGNTNTNTIDASFADAYGPSSSRLRSASSASDSATMWRRQDDAQAERNLVGSLTSSYPFAKGGLCKKTISIQIDGSTHHLISYYTVDDVRSGRLRTPSSLPEIASLSIAPSLLAKTSFRFPPAVSIGPDGVPRFRAEEMESSSSSNPSSPHLIHHHDSSGEGTSSGSGSESRRGGGAGGGLGALSGAGAGTGAGGSHRRRGGGRGAASSTSSGRHAPLAHQVGGSGAFVPSRRSSEFSLSPATHRYEPYGYPGFASSQSSNHHLARPMTSSSSMSMMNFASAFPMQPPYTAPSSTGLGQQQQQEQQQQQQQQYMSHSHSRPHHQHHHSASSPLISHDPFASGPSPWLGPAQAPPTGPPDFGASSAPATASSTTEDLTSLNLGGLAAFSAVDESQQQPPPQQQQLHRHSLDYAQEQQQQQSVWPSQQGVSSLLADDSLSVLRQPATAGVVYVANNGSGSNDSAWSQQQPQSDPLAQPMGGVRAGMSQDAYSLPMDSSITHQQQHSSSADGQYHFPPFAAPSSSLSSIAFTGQQQQAEPEEHQHQHQQQQQQQPMPVQLHSAAQARRFQGGHAQQSPLPQDLSTSSPTSAALGTIFLQKPPGNHRQHH